ncbi:unnamed protein product [Prunus armeniaca]|uniref:Uncharacterized protein n=1 Tax=Prunus armeniaca TaxID=36596 RepID=A0A6J5VIB4_PRUAR|nr:unnamed protein product [Prunus armeniaca]
MELHVLIVKRRRAKSYPVFRIILMVIDINEQNYCTEPCLTSGNGHVIVDSRESELPNNIWEGESHHIFESLRG